MLLGVGVLAAGAPDATQYFRYARTVPTAAAGQTCAPLDAAVYAHAEPSLKDLRLVGRGGGAEFEVPYVLTVSEAQAVASEVARVERLERHGDAVVFDLEMPSRAYTDVVLELAGKDFVGTARVRGSARAGAAPVELGEFTVFDLASQHLARSTTLHLAETTFPLLHVELRVRAADGRGARRATLTVAGATVPPSREAQTLYTVAATERAVTESAHATVARFRLPPRVPVERVRVVLDASYRGNFSRTVRVMSHTLGAGAAESETVAGRIERIRMERDGVALDDEVLTVPATLGANLQEEAEVEVAIEDGDEAPLPVRAVELEMRQRSLCFEASAARSLELFYGDAALAAPAYDYVRTYAPALRPEMVRLGTEQLNAGWRQRPETRSLVERRPHLAYYALLGAVCVLALAAFRSGKVQHSHRR